MTLEDIQQAIARLSAEDRAKLRAWLAELEARQGEQPEPETTASKLGRLAGRAVADVRKRMRQP
jgi:cytochrome c553